MIILDRYEGDIAVIEDNGEMKNISRTLIAENVKEGSVIIKQGEKYVLDEDKTNARRKKIVGLQDSLFE